MSPAAWRRTASRSRRRTRLRATALPTFLVTVNPTRAGPSSPRSRTSSRKNGPRRFSPARAARNSDRLRSIRSAGPTGLPGAGKSARSLGGEPLSAAGGPRRDHAAAAFGGQAGPESVAALADKLGRLIGALHLF